MDTSANLIQESLEYFLKREGITEIIAEHRRDKVFTSPVLYLWLIGLWVPASYISYNFGNKNLLLSILIPVIFFVVFFLLTSIYYGIRKFRDKKDISDSDASSLVGLFIIGTPVFIALGLGLIFWSWIIPLSYVGVYTCVMIIALLIQKQGYRIYALFDLTLSVFKDLAQSLKYIIVILPLLLIIILLSVFSSDLWKIIGLAPLARLFSIFALILFPALLLYVSSLEGQTKDLIASISERGYILSKINDLQFLKKKMEDGLISNEEWQELLRQLKWRYFDKLLSDIQPIIHNKTKRWLALLVGITSFLLLLVFFVYFYIFFSVAIESSTIADWTGLKSTPPLWVLNIGSGFWIISLSSINLAVIKVSLVLATFAGAMSIVYSLTDETIKKLFTGWLIEKSSLWITACCLYKTSTEFNHQFWEYVVNDKKRGIANLSIIVPEWLLPKQVEEVCGSIANCYKEYHRIVIITAFEQIPGCSLYKRSGPGRWWQYLNNKITGYQNFIEVPSSTNEIRYQHFLGRECQSSGNTIPDEWFGDTSKGIKFGKDIWKIDGKEGWVLHPYVSGNEKMLSLDIHLTKKKSSSNEYKKYVKQLATLALKTFPNSNMVTIDLYFRDTSDFLANLVINKEINHASYRDEKIKGFRFETIENWLT